MKHSQERTPNKVRCSAMAEGKIENKNMSEEHFEFENDLFQLKDGRFVTDERISEKLYYIKKTHPEYPPADNTGYSWDEAGMADLFAECYKEETAYCPEMKSWLVYDDGIWNIDSGALRIAGKIKEFVRIMSLYCGEIKDEDRRKEYVKFVGKMGDRRFRDRLMKDAADGRRIEASKLDSHPYLINCKNGTYNLKDGTFRPHNWKDYLTMRTAFDYTLQRVSCPRWEKFIDEVTEGDKEKAEYLQKALGYSILGEAKEECMFILHGKTTRNGKSTLLDAVQHMLGDYSTVAPVDLICGRENSKADKPTPYLASLKGTRFVTMAESESSGKLNESAIKQYTGGEEITARFLHQNPVVFKPQFTLWLSCNDLPSVWDKSLFASDRIRVIEFNRHFTDEEQDKGLKTYFESDEAMPGIFAWLIEGYRKYKQDGLAMPSSIRAVVKQYEKDNDIVLQFLEDMCIRDADTSYRAKDLYDGYKIWCRRNGYTACSVKKFNALVEQHPEWYDEITTPGNRKTFKGLSLKP